jgi:hypothetical protein
MRTKPLNTASPSVPQHETSNKKEYVVPHCKSLSAKEALAKLQELKETSNGDLSQQSIIREMRRKILERQG